MWDPEKRSYSHIVKIENPSAIIFLAGMAAVNEKMEVSCTDIEDQVVDTFRNIEAQLAAAGATLEDIADMTVYMKDIKAHGDVVRRVRRELIPNAPPTSTMVGGAEFTLDGLLVEIDVIAVT
jgi:enamine deaminase RidA (YjgF/YER057c/UK114 family)